MIRPHRKMYVAPTPQLNQGLLVASCRPDESIPHSHECNHIVRQRLVRAHPGWRWLEGAPRRSARNGRACRLLGSSWGHQKLDMCFKADVGAIYAHLCTQITAARCSPGEQRALFSVVLTSIKEQSYGIFFQLCFCGGGAWATSVVMRG